jgi:hypothetical protein
LSSTGSITRIASSTQNSSGNSPLIRAVKRSR